MITCALFLIYTDGKMPDNVCIAVFVLLKVATVEGFINSVDSQMRQRQEQQKLATISARIDSYEAVEGSSEEVEKVRNHLRGPSTSKKKDLIDLTYRFHAFVFSLSDPQGVQLLRPHGSHERNITGGDTTAASRGSTEDERGQRQSGKTDSQARL